MTQKYFTLLLALIICNSINTQTLDKKDALNTYFKPAKWRCIGPFRGGRSVTSTGVIGDPSTYYMGNTGGGVWKTEDMGMSWKNISDGFFTTGTIGAITVAPSDPNVVYVGSGEHAIRGVMTHSGDGMYKSTDAGKTWSKSGLELSQHIARIIVHPTNPDIVYVAVQGALYSKSKERGLYKTIDGGTTWKNVLSVDDQTGCNEISMDANNPRILYASMWEHGRQPWQIKSGGPGSGLYKSTDSGDHWEKMEKGLPKEMGKMSIAVCPSNSEKVYALIESNFDKEAGGLYTSNDAGKSWSQTTGDHRLIQRAWYYIELFVDPLNENTIYVMSAPALRSMDGGSTWEDISSTHGDYHNLWINPKNSNNMIISDDGGAAVTFNKGKSWSSQNIYPTAQFYRINVDNLFPYNIYAGQQDNSTVKIASRNINGGSISNRDWSSSAGGESAFLAFNPDDPQYVMGGSYQGTIDLFDSKNKSSVNVMAAPIQYLGRDAKDMKYRFNWNAPVIYSKHDANTFYHGSQHLLRTRDMGKTWEEASPDLTRNDKTKQNKPGVPYTNEAVGAENYGTLAYVLESPLEKGVIYTGSDDGLVHITKDNGKSWTNITPKDLKECLINAIEVSPFDKATVYIATTRYKFNDHAPGLYKSTDYGKTWVQINNGIGPKAFTRVVREDDKKKDLLFAGTETGLYISWNGGKEWSQFNLNLPIAPITDLKIHQDNLIAATSGRAFWILDDLNLVRQYNKETKTLMVYKPSLAYITNSSSDLDGDTENFTGISGTNGVNPASGVVCYYNLPEMKDEDNITMEIHDTKGNLIKTYSSKSDSTYKKYDGGPKETPKLPKNTGLNRFVWDMSYPTMPGIKDVYIEGSYSGHRVVPADYKITIKKGDQVATTMAEIKPNPYYNVSTSQYEAYNSFMLEMENNLTNMHNTINKLDAKKQQLNELINSLPADTKYDAIKKTIGELVKKITAWDEEMIQRKTKAYDDAENFPNKFTSDYLYLINQTNNDLGRINQPSIDLRKSMDAQWNTLNGRATSILDKELPDLNTMICAAGLGAIWK